MLFRSYIRHGADWNTILDNLHEIKNNCPHIFIQLAPTVSILNAFHISKLHMCLVNEKIINAENVHFNILTYPTYYSLTALPSSYKQQVEAHWQEYHKIIDNMGHKHLANEILKVIKYMYSHDHSSVVNQLIAQTTVKDKIRNENFLSVFPEYTDLFTV